MEIVKYEIDTNTSDYYSQWVTKLGEGTEHHIHKVYRTVKTLIKYDQKNDAELKFVMAVCEVVKGMIDEILNSPAVFILVSILENEKTAKMV